MNFVTPMPTAGITGRLSSEARARMHRPLFRADWLRAVFIHYEVEPEALQRCVPFELDLREGRAYVSLVAFTIRQMRTGAFAPLGRLLLRPISDHGFLNARTYVRHGGETGIYFLAEWLSKRFPVPFGRPAFGLPYRHGRLDYQHDHESGEISGTITGKGGVIGYRGVLDARSEFCPCDAGSLDEFLLERYTAFTRWHGRTRMFHVWHEPWPQSPIALKIERDDLLLTTGDWPAYAHVIGAHYSPGAHDVWMGHPQRRERNREIIYE